MLDKILQKTFKYVPRGTAIKSYSNDGWIIVSKNDEENDLIIDELQPCGTLDGLAITHDFMEHIDTNTMLGKLENEMIAEFCMEEIRYVDVYQYITGNWDSVFLSLSNYDPILKLPKDINKELLVEFKEYNYDESQVDDWLRENIINRLTYVGKEIDSDFDIIAGEIPFCAKIPNQMYFKGRYIETPETIHCVGDKEFIKKHLLEFLSNYHKIDIWSDCLSYDWVLFNNIFGHAFNLPKNINYIPFDICTLFKLKGIDPDISREEFACVKGFSEDGIAHNIKNKHRADHDAFVIKACYEKLIKM